MADFDIAASYDVAIVVQFFFFPCAYKRPQSTRLRSGGKWTYNQKIKKK